MDGKSRYKPKLAPPPPGPPPCARQQVFPCTAKSANWSKNCPFHPLDKIKEVWYNIDVTDGPSPKEKGGNNGKESCNRSRW